MRILRLAAVVVCLELILLPGLARAQDDPVSLWLNALVSARLRSGAAPVELSPGLCMAAQRHANDLAATMIVSDTGSDGSTAAQRIQEAGYFAWTDEEDVPLVGEVCISTAGGIDEALAAMLQEPTQRDVALDPLYREVGVGAAADATGRNYYVLTFGARPNVLPIFINDGAYNTLDPQIALHLSNEEARPEGHGVAIGRVVEVRINHEPVWDHLPWQAWEEFVPWTLPDAPGDYTVYVQLRDAAGRTVSAADMVHLGEGVPPTRAPVVLPSVAPGPAAGSPTPEGGAPSGTPTATQAVLTVTPAAAASLVTTPFPTWTPLPTPVPPQEEAEPHLPLGLVVALLGVAIVLGLVLVLRRPQQPGGEDHTGDRPDAPSP